MVPSSCSSVLRVTGSPDDSACALRLSAAIDSIRHAASETSIGMVAFFTHKNEKAEAILDVDGKWRCPKLPVLDRVLNALHEPKGDPGRDMLFGHAELIRVAAWLKGAVCFHHPLPDDHGRYDVRGRGARTKATVMAS